MSTTKKLKGFTLIEILVAVALIAILAAITIIAINPARNFQDTRNTQRRSDVTQILNAVTQYTSRQGNTLAGLGTIRDCTTGVTSIGTTTSGTAGEWINLTSNLVDEYIVAIPRDPNSTSDADTLYDICQSGTTGRVEVRAPQAEGGVTVTARR